MSYSGVGPVYLYATGSFVGGFVRKVSIGVVTICFFYDFSLESTLLVCKECSLSILLTILYVKFLMWRIMRPWCFILRSFSFVDLLNLI